MFRSRVNAFVVLVTSVTSQLEGISDAVHEIFLLSGHVEEFRPHIISLFALVSLRLSNLLLDLIVVFLDFLRPLGDELLKVVEAQVLLVVDGVAITVLLEDDATIFGQVLDN